MWETSKASAGRDRQNTEKWCYWNNSCNRFIRLNRMQNESRRSQGDVCGQENRETEFSSFDTACGCNSIPPELTSGTFPEDVVPPEPQSIPHYTPMLTIWSRIIKTSLCIPWEGAAKSRLFSTRRTGGCFTMEAPSDLLELHQIWRNRSDVK